MYRAKKGLSTRSGGKPTDHAFVDNDGIYDPDCEASGVFKAKQCNNTDICWCVNSAGVRRTDKGGQDLKCEKLVETVWVQAQLKHKDGVNLDQAQLKSAMANAIAERYSVDAKLVTDVTYDKDSRTILVDLKKGTSNVDIATVGYYMEKDIKVLPLFYNDSKKFSPSVDSKNVEFENILVYYVDAEPPTFTMKRLTAGVVAVIVVVVLAIIAGLVVLFISNKRQASAMYQKPETKRRTAVQGYFHKTAASFSKNMRSCCALLALALVAKASAQGCVCNTMKWATCEVTPGSCECTAMVAEKSKQVLNCNALIPKCFLMKAEVFRTQKGLSSRSGGKPTEHAFVDDDGIYDPDCEANGVFKAKQCAGSQTCWWLQIQLKHMEVQLPLNETQVKTAITQTISQRYLLDEKHVTDVKFFPFQYERESHTVVVDLKSDASGDGDIATVGYYIEKDVKRMTLFRNAGNTLTASVNGTQVDFESFMIYYVDEKPPTFTTNRVMGGVIAATVVIALAIVAVLLLRVSIHVDYEI
ncbi:Epithelial cell adhesion molecule [Acipenser ruthenus]|uniref:Epithelial cell adhesion molecule n=1 Tax=Acipenser ruthenus TaxID=7906 RepID=A0A444UGX0_ACIRT|nr:Epithelial cell adhesion molecule [Acipenser ruthenus]